MSLNRPIFREIHQIFDVIRQLVHDNRVLYNSIDEAYESILLDDLKLVPEQFDSDILKIVRAVKTIFTNINYKNISQGIDDITGGILSFNLNTFEQFKKGFEKIEMPRKDKSRILNIVSKFRPLFSAIDAMLAEPLVYIRRAAALSDNQYDDIF